MYTRVDLRSLVSRRGLAATVLFLGAVAVVATRPSLLGRRVSSIVDGLETARPIWLWAAACCFGASLIASSWSWRAALALCGGKLSRSDAAARFAIGSLVNSLSPARVGEVVRLALFARGLEGKDRGWRMGGVFGVIAALRSLVFAIVVVCAAAVGAMPFWPVLALAAVAGIAGVLAFSTRNRAPRKHAAHLLDAFRGLGRSPAGGMRIAGWTAAATGFKLAGAASIAVALGVHSPVTAALIIVPTLDVAGLMPLSGNVGITSGAVAVALQAHGVGIVQALAAGLAFHAVQTGAGIAFGTAGALLLRGQPRTIPRRLFAHLDRLRRNRRAQGIAAVSPDFPMSREAA